MRRSKLFRTALILALVVLGVWYLIPTYQSITVNRQIDERIGEIAGLTGVAESELQQNMFRFDVDIAHQIRIDTTISADDRDRAVELVNEVRTDLYDRLSSSTEGAIKLGLDLQGGMHLVLEVNLVELMNDMAKNKDGAFDEIMTEIRTNLDENPDAGFEEIVMAAFQSREIPMARYFGDPRQSDREILRSMRRQADEAVNLTLTTLRNRVDEFGVSEPSITKQGARRIVVELPGVQDAARARSLIGRTALLEFKLLAPQEITAQVLKEIDGVLSRKLAEEGAFDDMPVAEAKTTPETQTGDQPLSTTELFSGDAGADDTTASAQAQALNRERPFSGLLSLYQREIVVPASDRKTIERFLGREDVRSIIPPEYQFLWSHKQEVGNDGLNYWRLYMVKSRAEITGSALSDAQLTIGGNDPTQAGAPIVNLTMNREGARRFARITESNIGEQLAIVLDDKVHMAPYLRTRIPDGRAIIEGADSVEEASDLAIVLRAGALPAPVEIIEERTVGPSLGADSIRAGLLSAILGLSLVMVFMAFYYRGSGLIADLVLMLNILFLMAVLAGFGFTLTLPGIAGIILTIGMAVDANVLIFERIREELVAGKTVWNAIKNGYDRAFITIMDANVTTLIAGIVLYQFGTGPIRGFALTLMIGIVASMFTALVVSRAIFDWITAKWTVKKLSI